MERKDYIRMDQEIIRTLDPKIICFACQKFTAKRPNEHYSFEADFSAFFCIHMKKLPNSLKYLQENDEIPEKVAAKDISQKCICTMVESKSETKIKQLALSTTMKIS